MTDAELRELEDELRTNYGDSYVSWWVEEKMERLIEEVRRLRRVLQAMTISGRGGHEFRRLGR